MNKQAALGWVIVMAVMMSGSKMFATCYTNAEGCVECGPHTNGWSGTCPSANPSGSVTPTTVYVCYSNAPVTPTNIIFPGYPPTNIFTRLITYDCPNGTNVNVTNTVNVTYGTTVVWTNFSSPYTNFPGAVTNTFSADCDAYVGSSDTNRCAAPGLVNLGRVTWIPVQIKLTNPTGSFTTSPVEGQNQFTFSSDSPGMLSIVFQASVSPSTSAALNYASNLVTFSIDSIAGSTLSWDPPANGKPKIVGGGLQATAIFSNMPSANSAFGIKVASMSTCSSMSTNIGIFFPKNATNHPSGQAGSPNWFYYWSETMANKATTTMVYTNGARSHYDYFANHTIFLMDDAAGTQIAAWGSPKGIDTFAWTTAHEGKHHTQLTSFWPTTWNGANDTDSDWLPNNQEATYMSGRPYDPNNRTTYPDSIGYGEDPIPDVEDIDMRSQTSPYNLDQLWTNGNANKVDWANPGKNSETKY